MTRATPGVLAEVQRERQRQEARWGEQNLDPAVWLMVLGEEVGEANNAALEHLFTQFDKQADLRGARSLDDYRAELIQVAAVAVSAVESLDRQRARAEQAQGPAAAPSPG
ncbi:hypothetical protein [Deinococcus arcticus]|uniref:Uncharacterized protein n=1 Tax=Deinococcus arcticus TaxID=2136176 RepID=A0A2T3W725_9DEIO|nr:hypothetical protein [Deinococcus arcticus]PTA67677.1 hypothetical protein C8263_11220 [Deinococcus arcticus]